MAELRPVPREAVLIVNARSRKGRDLFRRARALLEEAGVRLIADHPVRDPRRLKHIVDQAVADGAPMVIVGGGDGSLSCSVDFVVGKDCVFALLPLGTANSFARSLDIPLDLEGAVDAIANGRRRRVDLGLINGDYFANSAAMGLAPMIADSVPHRLKKYLGRFGYLVWAIWCLIRFRPFAARINVDGKSHTFTALELRIANGRFHGGVEVVDEVDGDGVDSGEIVVQIVTGRYKRAADLELVRHDLPTGKSKRHRRGASRPLDRDRDEAVAQDLGRRRGVGTNAGERRDRAQGDRGGGALGATCPLIRHCEERSDAAIQAASEARLDCHASLAMTNWVSSGRSGFNPAARARRGSARRPRPFPNDRRAPSRPPRAWPARRSSDWRDGRRGSRVPSRRPRPPWRARALGVEIDHAFERQG